MNMSLIDDVNIKSTEVDGNTYICLPDLYMHILSSTIMTKNENSNLISSGKVHPKSAEAVYGYGICSGMRMITEFLNQIQEGIDFDKNVSNVEDFMNMIEGKDA